MSVYSHGACRVKLSKADLGTCNLFLQLCNYFTETILSNYALFPPSGYIGNKGSIFFTNGGLSGIGIWDFLQLILATVNFTLQKQAPVNTLKPYFHKLDTAF